VRAATRSQRKHGTKKSFVISKGERRYRRGLKVGNHFIWIEKRGSSSANARGKNSIKVKSKETLV